MHLFIITGTPRSGTSLTAAICVKLGLYLGEYPDNGDEHNPLGYFEDKTIGGHAAYFHDEDGTAKPAPHNDSHYVDSLRDRMAERARDKWGFKSCFLNPHFFQAIQQAAPCPISAIVTDRAIEASTASWSKMKGFDKERANAQITRQKAWVEDLKSKVQNVLIVSYDDLVNTPEPVVKSIAEFIGLPFNQEAVKLVNPEWRHF